ncbi:MAG: hypothetical protein MI863_10350 [Desulfobacterales bacterium]|nr:hypothetical protein [Desulfobacterales bacterium]
MDKELLKIAAHACDEVNQDPIGPGTTGYKAGIRIYRGKPIQVLAIACTGETGNRPENTTPWSIRWRERAALEVARRLQFFGRIPELPLLVCGHASAGAAAIAFKRLFKADYCVAFAPEATSQAGKKNRRK